MKYAKPPLTIEQQVDLLECRGLIIWDRLRATRWLKHVSYYRLSAYMLPFKAGEAFTPGTTFDQIAGLYIFDRKLRLVLLDGIERIEVALRTALTYELAHAQGPFGCVSRMYSACAPSIKRKIANRFSVQDWQFASWLHTLSYVRNVCAHHSRLWNRELAVRPSIPNLSRAWPHPVPSADRLYCVLAIVRHCLIVTAPRCQWRERFLELLDRHPEVDLIAMRFPPEWRTIPLWAAASTP